MNCIIVNDKDMLERVSLEKHVTQDCPPAFIWHTFNDAVVPVENSLCFAAALAKASISTELHVFPKGPHGLSLANEWLAGGAEGVVPEVQEWSDMAVRWVDNL